MSFFPPPFQRGNFCALAGKRLINGGWTEFVKDGAGRQTLLVCNEDCMGKGGVHG